MSKRKAPGNSRRSSSSSGRGRKKSFFKTVRPGQSRADLASGIMALYVTHDPGKAGPCVTDMRSWLEDWVERVYPAAEYPATPPGRETGSGDEEGDEDESDTTGEDGPSHPVSVSSALEEELAELRREMQGPGKNEGGKDGGKKKIRFTRSIREVPGVARSSQGVCLHFSHHYGVDIGEVVRQMLTAVQRGEEAVRCRTALKLSPFQNTCFSDPELLQKIAEPLIQSALSQEPPGTTWGIVFERQQENKRMDRAACIHKLTTLIPKHCVVDLKNPKWTILVKIMGRVTGVSVVRDYKNLARYNLRKLHTDVLQAKEARRQEEQKRKEQGEENGGDAQEDGAEGEEKGQDEAETEAGQKGREGEVQGEASDDDDEDQNERIESIE